MVELAWPIASVLVCAMLCGLGVVWLQLRAEATKAQLERDEREHGVVAKLRASVEAQAEEFRQMRIDWKAFQANNRR